jgi:hypothetical protein
MQSKLPASAAAEIDSELEKSAAAKFVKIASSGSFVASFWQAVRGGLHPH